MGEKPKKAVIEGKKISAQDLHDLIKAMATVNHIIDKVINDTSD